MWFMGQGMQNPNQVGAGAHPYMHLMGIVALGLLWLRMAKAAGAALADGGEDKAFLDAKRVTARYFADRIMRSEEPTSALQSLMRISSVVFCLQNKQMKFVEYIIILYA